MGDLLTDDRLDDVRSGDVHVGTLLHHKDPVGKGRGIDGAAGGGSHDGGDLGDVPRADGVAVEDAAVAVQGRDAFLDPGAARIVHGHEGLPGVQGHVHDLPDLLGVHLAQAPAGAGEVLGRRKDGPAVHLAETDDDTVGVDLLLVQAEEGGTVLHEQLHLLKCPLVIKHRQTFPGRKLAEFMLLGDHLFAAHGLQGFPAGLEYTDLFFRHSFSLFFRHKPTLSLSPDFILVRDVHGIRFDLDRRGLLMYRSLPQGFLWDC